ncbi:MAG: TonB-dependent receptor, partial [Bacteroidales bacterium]|nr:TonB-dependent receptor [Bacteroidales bacterium]
MKKIVFISLFLCLAQIINAQTSIVGRILDKDDRTPIPFAQVAIFSVKDTSLVAGAITSDNGSFTIERVRKDQYIFRAMYVGYTTFEKVIDITDESKPFAMGRIEMVQGVELQGFEISETFIPVQMSGDTIDYNAEAFRPVAGSALEELIKRLPGAEVDADGNITMGGKPITKILVDGQSFFDDDPKVAARNIPADFVQRVRTYDRRSDQSRFTGIDDGNEETVIDLSFKPGMAKGWFGRLTGGIGHDAVKKGNFRYDNSFNINYFRDKDQLTILGGFNNVNNLGFSDMMNASNVQVVTVGRGGGGRGGGFGGFGGMQGGITQSFSPGVNFIKKFNENLSVGGSYAYSRSDREQRQRTYREDILPEGRGSQFYDDTMTSEPITNQHRFNAEIKYTPDEANELIIRPSFTYGNTKNTRWSDYMTYRWIDEIQDTLNSGTTTNISDATNFSARLRADYRRRLNKPRRTIGFELDGGYSFNNREDFNISDITFWRNGVPELDEIDQLVTNKGGRYNWSTQVAYTEPLPYEHALELRYTFSNSEDWTERITERWNPVTQKYDDLDSAFSNDFSNTFFNQRFEARIQKSTDKYRYSFGLGVFPAHSRSYSEGKLDADRRVFNFAPQAQFRYQFSRQHTLTFNYSGRTNQPSVSQLQPVPDNSDLTNIRVGNPELDPEFNHRISAMYNNFFQNFSSISANVFLNITQNRIVNTTITDLLYNTSEYPKFAGIDSLNPGARIIMPENVGHVYNLFGMVSYSTPLFSQKITLSSTTGGGVSNTKSQVDQKVNDFIGTLGPYWSVRPNMYRLDVSQNARLELGGTDAEIVVIAS